VIGAWNHAADKTCVMSRISRRAALHKPWRKREKWMHDGGGLGCGSPSLVNCHGCFIAPALGSSLHSIRSAPAAVDDTALVGN
jgi:hypothetical protein